MGLTVASIAATGSWTQTRSTTGTLDVTQGPDSVSPSVTLDVTSINRLGYWNISLAASGTATYDLTSVTTLISETDAWTKVQAIVLTVDSGGGNIKLEPGASNPATWFFSGTSPAITVKAGGFLALGDGSTYTIDATHKTLKVTNTSSSLAVTGKLVIYGGT